MAHGAVEMMRFVLNSGIPIINNCKKSCSKRK